MIFNEEQNIKDFIVYFYHIMPTIHTYTIKLTLKILQQLQLINEIEYMVNNSLTTNRFLMFSNEKKNKELEDLLNETILICPRCFKEINYKNKNIELLKIWKLECPHCKKMIYLDKFLFYNCHKEGAEYKRGRYKKQ